MLCIFMDDPQYVSSLCESAGFTESDRFSFFYRTTYWGFTGSFNALANSNPPELMWSCLSNSLGHLAWDDRRIFGGLKFLLAEIA